MKTGSSTLQAAHLQDVVPLRKDGWEFHPEHRYVTGERQVLHPVKLARLARFLERDLAANEGHNLFLGDEMLGNLAVDQIPLLEVAFAGYDVRIVVSNPRNKLKYGTNRS